MNKTAETSFRRNSRNRQSIVLGLILTVEKLFPNERLRIMHSIPDGIYCELENSLLSPREVEEIEKELLAWIAADIPISSYNGTDGFIHCQMDGQELKSLFNVLDRSGAIQYCRLFEYPPGFILHYIEYNNPDSCTLLVPPEKLSDTFSESQIWVENLGLAKVKDVNDAISAKNTIELISLAEALHEKKISLIADRILRQRRNVRVILIAGPSSSGKTTFTQRLSTQLKVNNLRPVSLSLDNYFLSREHTPRETSGLYNYDAIEALDLKLLDSHLKILIKGGTVETPVYDFISGKRCSQGTPLHLKDNEILLIEGIHGLNPRLLPSLDRNQLFKIYISALFQSNIDNYNRVPTSEVRLIRRLVRDNRTRGISPEQTFAQWNSVRRAENTIIFPYQEEADIMFNSTLLYELNALRTFAEPLLKPIPKDSPHQDIVSLLLRMLSFFKPIDVTKIPFNSILREFIGGGLYKI
ncbi:MAG: nucleoside kinase [Desulfitobacteriaceae bacterium]|nr:nucleoside kinase [Desulfitobacteriaceae bacterium]MDD4346235.1 nucleoside kinase [Desulfitobacteriaceae bacterium]MDD4401632.1 nucleoside kinase [Desulfitobacteriaceae bacterium]